MSTSILGDAHRVIRVRRIRERGIRLALLQLHQRRGKNHAAADSPIERLRNGRGADEAGRRGEEEERSQCRLNHFGDV